jgi:hypothetical protein
MSSTMTDSLKVYDILKEAQIPDLQARAITGAIREAECGTALNVKTVLEERLQHFATKADLANAKSELTRWMFVFWAGQVAATITVVKLWK